MSASTISAKIRNSLEILTKMHGISEAELCRKTKISQATLWRLFNSDTDPRTSTLNIIATYFGVTFDQLLGNQPITKANQKNTEVLSGTIYIPIFSLDKASELISMIGKITASNWNKWLAVESTINKSCFAVEVIGESMWPLFIEGVLIIIDPTIIPRHKNYVLSKQHNTNEIIFRQFIEENNEKLLKPVHYAYKTISFKKNDLILGVIIQSRNKFVE